jgi:YbgC/YbaW family acyl-CoA thioester hydrolase
MLWLYCRAWTQPLIPANDFHNQLVLRVWPNDLDIAGHVNNGRYLTYCDLSRFDLFVRSGLLKVMRQRKWVPLIAYHDMHYKSSLKLFQKFSLTMNIAEFDEKYFYGTHKFSRNDRVVAEGVSHAVIRSREGVVPPSDVIDAVKEFQEAR